MNEETMLEAARRCAGYVEANAERDRFVAAEAYANLAQAYAAIAQAEAAERQADALESIAYTCTAIVGKVDGSVVVKTWDDMTASQVGRIVQALNTIAGALGER